jgi:hypothetical protein
MYQNKNNISICKAIYTPMISCAEWLYYYLKKTNRNSKFRAKALPQELEINKQNKAETGRKTSRNSSSFFNHISGGELPPRERIPPPQ